MVNCVGQTKDISHLFHSPRKHNNLAKDFCAYGLELRSLLVVLVPNISFKIGWELGIELII